MGDEFHEYVERIVGERRKVIGPNIMKAIEDHLDILNRVETYLGCAKCHGPLTDGRCPKCQPTPAPPRGDTADSEGAE